MAGSSNCVNESRAPSEARVAQPATTPGTVIGSGPPGGIRSSPATADTSKPAAAAPAETIARTSPSGDRNSAIRSPPTEHWCG